MASCRATTTGRAGARAHEGEVDLERVGHRLGDGAGRGLVATVAQGILEDGFGGGTIHLATAHV